MHDSVMLPLSYLPIYPHWAWGAQKAPVPASQVQCKAHPPVATPFGVSTGVPPPATAGVSGVLHTPENRIAKPPLNLAVAQW
jgi:hypothetical protein